MASEVLDHEILPPEHTKFSSYVLYFPDVILYRRTTQKEYSKLLESLAKAKYLYTDGYTVKKINFLRYGWEEFKGYFGWYNGCQKERVNMSLMKLIYFGYVNDYNTTERLNGLEEKYGLPKDFIRNASKKRETEISKKLQNRLIGFYISNRKHFYKKEPNDCSIDPVNHNQSFGSTLHYLHFFELLPQLDPQDEILIESIITKLETGRGYKIHPKSTYAQYLADYYLNQVIGLKKNAFYNVEILGVEVVNKKPQAHLLLEKALTVLPTIVNEEKARPLFIEYYLEIKNFTKAINLIQKLTDPEQALKYIGMMNIPQHQVQAMVKVDSPLAGILSSELIKKGSLESIKRAAALHSPEQFSLLYPAAKFKLLIENKEYNKAYDIYKAWDAILFDKKDKQRLANFYEEMSTSSIKQVEQHTNCTEWALAKMHAKNCALGAKRAYELEPDSSKRREIYYSSQRFYGQTLITAAAENPEYYAKVLLEISKGLNLIKISLEKCPPKKKDASVQTSLAQGLILQAEGLAKKMRVSLEVYKNQELFEKHKKNKLNEIAIIINNMDEVITLLKDTKIKEQQTLLAQAYFLLADFKEFLNLSSYDPNYYLLAKNLAPENPFYHLRCSERFADKTIEYRKEGERLLKNLPFAINVNDYFVWASEFWLDCPQRESKISTIHNLKALGEAIRTKTIENNLA